MHQTQQQDDLVRVCLAVPIESVWPVQTGWLKAITGTCTGFTCFTADLITFIAWRIIAVEWAFSTNKGRREMIAGSWYDSETCDARYVAQDTASSLVSSSLQRSSLMFSSQSLSLSYPWPDTNGWLWMQPGSLQSIRFTFPKHCWDHLKKVSWKLCHLSGNFRSWWYRLNCIDSPIDSRYLTCWMLCKRDSCSVERIVHTCGTWVMIYVVHCSSCEQTTS